MNDMEELLEKIEITKAKKKIAVEAYDDHIKVLSTQLEAKMKAAGTMQLKTEVGTAFFQTNTSVKVKDWDVVMKYVTDNKAFDIIQRRISPAQLEARIKAGAVISGVTIEKTTSFMIRSAKE